jgi:hypothetical protein
MAVMIQCRVCHRHEVEHHAHGLCNRCYMRQWKTRVRLPPIEWSPYCECEEPVRERITLFDTWQCGNCGKPFR